MGRIIILSNRLPVSIEYTDKGKEPVITESIGGLAPGLKSVFSSKDSLWIGWSGLLPNKLSAKQRQSFEEKLKNNYQCLPIYLNEQQVDKFYYGFCNKTIWPLFHYFPNITDWDVDFWNAYCEVNEVFYKVISTELSPGDIIWVHDYQFMLLPEIIRKNHPEIKIGFFLHIPFPSYEIFRLLPVREEILHGILGADLVGFHTYDYVRHFLSSVRRILGYENTFGKITEKEQNTLIDAFPMGIDYNRFNHSGKQKSICEGTAKLLNETKGKQVILSVDRLDYTKGIPERIRAFGQFLEENPYFCGKVHLILITAPSRTKVDKYIDLKKEVEEMVSKVNGKHGKIGWIPIWFFYQSFNFNELAALYRGADVLLVTPLRDGMNLVVKEFIASKADFRGSVILSETAGASSELGEAILVNPNDINAISSAIKQSLEMPVIEQIKRNQIMHKRLKRYTVTYWAQEFLKALSEVTDASNDLETIHLITAQREKLLDEFHAARKRLLIFDYDGTLTPIVNTPEQAVPSKELLNILKVLADDAKTNLLIVSGRKKEDMQNWFGKLQIEISAEHGLWIRRKGQDWESEIAFLDDWKEKIRPIMESYVDRTPKSFIEEKTLGFAWHYRRCEPEQAYARLNELRDTLMEYIQNMNLCLIDGNKVLEVRDVNANKGAVVSKWLYSESSDFILCAGDDITDEDMFEVLPENSYSIKIGLSPSAARFHVKDQQSFINLLNAFIESRT